MTVAPEPWNKLPRPVRGLILVGLGSVATGSLLMANQNKQPIKRPQPAYFAVGVMCVSREALVSYTNSNDSYEFSCILPTGNPDAVALLHNVKTDMLQAGKPTRYNAVVPVMLPGEAIRFAFDGPIGTATAYDQYLKQ